MVTIFATLILGVLLGALFIIPRAIKARNIKVIPPNPANKASKYYTKDEVAVHNSRTDCWIIIKDKVYDVTPYVEEHPGGDAILAHAGDDSTAGFYGPQHATRVFDMIDDFYIGDVKQRQSTIRTPFQDQEGIEAEFETSPFRKDPC